MLTNISDNATNILQTAVKGSTSIYSTIINEMNSYIIVDNASHIYECKHCGMKSEPPWMTPPPDIAQDALDHFISEHKDCQSKTSGEKGDSASTK